MARIRPYPKGIRPSVVHPLIIVADPIYPQRRASRPARAHKSSPPPASPATVELHTHLSLSSCSLRSRRSIHHLLLDRFSSIDRVDLDASSLGVSCRGMPDQLYCNTFTSVNPSPAREMSELVCNGCPTMLVYSRGATNIRCPNCRTLNSTRSGANQMGQLQCGRCPTTLAYQLGASTVGCPRCRHVNPVRDARPQTVLVENPKTLDEKGKLVSNVAVGVTSWKR